MSYNYFDWDKLRKFVEERKPVKVSAGLLQDWFGTAASVYENGEWKDLSAPYLRSYWATPAFKAEMENGDTIEVVACIDSDEATDKEYEKRYSDAVSFLKGATENG